jgi:hypothetical protein
MIEKKKPLSNVSIAHLDTIWKATLLIGKVTPYTFALQFIIAESIEMAEWF